MILYSDKLSGAPPAYQVNAQRTLALLNQISALLGVDVRVTSGYRSVADNTRVGGSSTSAHLTAQAADFIPVGLPLKDAARKLEAAKARGAFQYGELFYYSDRGHIHVTLPGVGGDGETAVVVNGKFQPVAPWLGTATGLLLLLAFAALLYIRRSLA